MNGDSVIIPLKSIILSCLPFQYASHTFPHQALPRSAIYADNANPRLQVSPPSETRKINIYFFPMTTTTPDESSRANACRRLSSSIGAFASVNTSKGYRHLLIFELCHLL
jgi:hypothetical protein